VEVDDRNCNALYQSVHVMTSLFGSTVKCRGLTLFSVICCLDYQGMSTKVCTGCQRELPVEEFHWRSKKLGKRISRCRECASEWSKAHYRRNTESYAKKAQSWNDRTREEVRIRLLNYLRSHPCVDCGETDPLVLTFDHVRGEKRSNVSVLVAGKAPWSTVLTEIQKCDVRCANCHMRRTSRQLGYWKLCR